jgi:hypothetical protein
MGDRRREQRQQQRKAVPRQWHYREAETIDKVLALLDELAIHSSWRAVRRVIFYVLLVRWERVGKAINPGELEA